MKRLDNLSNTADKIKVIVRGNIQIFDHTNQWLTHNPNFDIS